MALVRVTWRETKEFEAEIEIDGYEGTDDELVEAVGELSSEAHDDAQFDGTTVGIQSAVTVRAGDPQIPVKVAAKQHEDMWS